jgi:hypothetical protein
MTPVLRLRPPTHSLSIFSGLKKNKNFSSLGSFNSSNYTSLSLMFIGKGFIFKTNFVKYELSNETDFE